MPLKSVSGEDNLHGKSRPELTHIDHFSGSADVHKVLLRGVCIHTTYRTYSGSWSTRNVRAYWNASNTDHLEECFHGKYVDGISSNDISQSVEEDLLDLTWGWVLEKHGYITFADCVLSDCGLSSWWTQLLLDAARAVAAFRQKCKVRVHRSYQSCRAQPRQKGVSREISINMVESTEISYLIAGNQFKEIYALPSLFCSKSL